MYFVYIIQSLKDNSYYIGSSQDPKVRLFKHNSSNTGYTSRKKPWKLIVTKAYDSKSEALKQEKYFKSLKRIDKVLELLASSAG